MHYSAYIKRTREAADVLGGEFVSLAGGYYGAQLPVDNGFVILALDQDGSSGWVCWKEDIDGERCCDNANEELGWLPLQDLWLAALKAVVRHQCS